MPQFYEIYLTIYGSVHGVSFRWYAREEAQKLGLVGWVKNNPDGTVSALAQGEKAGLEKLKEWCQSGPRWARVERVDEQWREIDVKSFDTFKIK